MVPGLGDAFVLVAVGDNVDAEMAAGVDVFPLLVPLLVDATARLG